MPKQSIIRNLLAVLIVMSFLASACGQNVEVTRVVTEKETVVQKETVIQKETIVETVMETIIVEGTPEVVEKEATRIVEVEKPVEVIVTATPEPSGVSRELVGEIEGPEIIVDPSQFPTEFNEAPELAAMVEAGELPPLEERLPEPEDLLVIKPLNQIGIYGGVWHRGFTGTADRWNYFRTGSGPDHPLFLDYTGANVVPNVLKGYEFSDEGATITLFLRRGAKWSDGVPFTADDIVFWYEDLYMNDEIRPSKSPEFGACGEQGVVEKVDDYTVQIKFTCPYYYFAEILATANGIGGGQTYRGPSGRGLFAPKHYLSQFLPKYVGEDAAQQKAEEEGFETWLQLYQTKADCTFNPDLPTLTPWITKVPITEPVWVVERNPYYFGVDSAGNQLPYIDRIEYTLVPNLEVLNLKAIAGDFDMQARHIDIVKLPIYLENQESAGYKIYIDPVEYGSDFDITPDREYCCDEVIADLLGNRDFRRALALGIDRDQLNEVFWLGLGVPGSGAPAPHNPYYPGDEWVTKWAHYDPDTANEMLDALGLDQRDSEGFRLRPDGQRLTLEMITQAALFIPYAKIGEMIADQWIDIGIDLDVTELEGGLVNEKGAAHEIMLSVWSNDGTERFLSRPGNLVPGLSSDWYLSGGTEGEEPEPGIRQIQDLYREMFRVPEDERIEMGKEIWKIHLDEVYSIGTVGLSPAVMGVRLVSTRMGNMPAGIVNQPDVKNPAIVRPQTFFFMEEAEE
jgi:peptide/nickel transport system substrate-binding protein